MADNQRVTTSGKVAAIRRAARDGRMASVNDTPEPRPTHSLITAVDQALDAGTEPSPTSLVPIVLNLLPPAERDAAFRETLRVYIETRIYERQGEPGMTRTESAKVRENRLRRVAKRQGFLLLKSRRRDPQAIDYGRYVLVGDSRGNRLPGAQAPISAFARGGG